MQAVCQLINHVLEGVSEQNASCQSMWEYPVNVRRPVQVKSATRKAQMETALLRQELESYGQPHFNYMPLTTAALGHYLLVVKRTSGFLIGCYHLQHVVAAFQMPPDTSFQTSMEPLQLMRKTKVNLRTLYYAVTGLPKCRQCRAFVKCYSNCGHRQGEYGRGCRSYIDPGQKALAFA